MQYNTIVLENDFLKELKEFYTPHFSNTSELESFIIRAFQYDYLDERKPRRMVFQVQRFVTLATEIDKIRPGRDGLRILFLKCCLESLAKLSGIDKNKKEKEKKAFYTNFCNFFSDEGRKYILDSFRLTNYDHIKSGVLFEGEYDLTLNDFLNIIKIIRDIVVHEGIYWETELFAYHTDTPLISCLETTRRIIPEEVYQNKSNTKTTYCFRTTLQYEKFIYYFVEACINYINDYIDKISSKK